MANRHLDRWFLLLLGTAILCASAAVGCRRAAEANETRSVGFAATVISRSIDDDAAAALTDAELRTLESVRKVDDHPLYVMTFDGDYDVAPAELSQVNQPAERQFACSLFACFDGPDGSLYGRNFDWYEHPALLLFTDPSDGYASVSMVDISYIGYSLDNLDDLETVEGRKALLQAPQLPFDGMNEKGLVVGMAAVPDSAAPRNENVPTLTSVGIIRKMLDNAETVDEALAMFDQFNVDFVGGPNIHYLIADRHGDAVLVELKDGRRHVHRNEDRWHVATNFYLTGNEEEPHRQCARYARLADTLAKADDEFTFASALKALGSVAQSHTRWSVVYGLDAQSARLSLSGDFDKAYSISLEEQTIE